MCSDYYREADTGIYQPRNVHLPKIELSEDDFGTLLVRTGDLIDSNHLRKLVCCCRIKGADKENIGDDPLKLFDALERLDRIRPSDFSYLAKAFERCQMVKLLNDFNELALALYRQTNPNSRVSQIGYDGVSIVHSYVNSSYNSEVPAEEPEEPGYEVPRSVVDEEENEDPYYSYARYAGQREAVDCAGQPEPEDTSRYDHTPPPASRYDHLPPPVPPREEKYYTVDHAGICKSIPQTLPPPPKAPPPQTPGSVNEEKDVDPYYTFFGTSDDDIYDDMAAPEIQDADGAAQEETTESTRRRFSLSKISSKLFGRKGSLQFDGKL